MGPTAFQILQELRAIRRLLERFAPQSGPRRPKRTRKTPKRRRVTSRS